jgi:hypothetical protein
MKLYIFIILSCFIAACGTKSKSSSNDFPVCAVKDMSGPDTVFVYVPDDNLVDTITINFFEVDTIKDFNGYVIEMYEKLNENEAFRGDYYFTGAIFRLPDEDITMRDLILDNTWETESRLYKYMQPNSISVFVVTSDISTGGYAYIPPASKEAREKPYHQLIVIGDNLNTPGYVEGIVHEVGHFYGLEHKFGGARSCCNYMNYVNCMTAFTKPQLDTIKFYATEIKSHLIRGKN